MNFLDFILENIPIIFGSFSFLGSIIAPIVIHLLNNIMARKMARNKKVVKLTINKNEITLNHTNEKELLDLIEKINGEKVNANDDQMNTVEKIE